MTGEIYSADSQKLVSLLVNARNEAGLTQKSAAAFLGKTQSYLSKVESGQRRVDLIELKQFCRVYKKPLSYFVNL